MKTNVTFSDFTDAFRNHNRQDQFSYAALRALFDWFEDYEEGCGEEIELDVIAICCDWGESGSALEWCDEMGYTVPSIDDDDDEDDKEEKARDYLNDNTQTILFGGGFLAIGF